MPLIQMLADVDPMAAARGLMAAVQATVQGQASPSRTVFAQPRIIVVSGPPASGKGTQCKMIVSQTGFVHISIGDIYRDAVERGTELGRQAQVYLDRNDFVPDEMVTSLVADRIRRPDALERGCLLDGFPRTAAQAESLARLCNVERVVVLMLPNETSMERALARRLDPETGAIYNLKTVPPPKNLEARLVLRDNDATEEVVRTRLGVYAALHGRILQVFPGKIQHIDAQPNPSEVFADLSSVLTSPVPPPSFDVARTEAAVNGTTTTADVGDDGWSDDDAVEPSAIASAKLAIAPCTAVGYVEGGECRVMVAVEPPNHPDGPRAPVDVGCLLDISGSMGTRATYDGPEGQVQDDGYSLLDIAKHAVKTVIHMLGDEDRFTLIVFQSDSRCVFPLGYMNAAGKRAAAAAVESLTSGGQTNLWKGLYTAMEALRDKDSRQVKTLLMLTDGIPSDTGHLEKLRAYRETHPDFHLQVNTFGFGKQLNSSLLVELAACSHGTYAFVPDALILGTSFVDCIANVQSTLTQSSTLHITAKGGSEFAGPVLGDYPTAEASWGRVISLGPLQFGQRREIVVPMRLAPGTAPYIQATIDYTEPLGKRRRASTEVVCREATNEALVAEARCDMVSVGNKAVKDFEAGQEADAMMALRAVADRVAAIAQGLPDLRLTELSKDIAGRMTKSFDGRDRFHRWGKHFVRALMRSHQVQCCTNFMDPGLQVYGGERFRIYRGQGDQVFLGLPMAKPAAPAPSPQRHVAPAPAQYRYVAAEPSNYDYYGGGGGG